MPPRPPPRSPQPAGHGAPGRTAMNSPATDGQLIERSKAGDRDAFGNLVDKYQDHLVRFVARRLPNRDDAQDVAQETLIRAYSAIGDFRGDAKFATWLFRIGLNMVTDFQVIEARRRALTSGAGGRWGVPQHWIEGNVDTEDPETILSSRQLAMGLAEAIAALTPELRRVLMLREFDGLSYAEIAHKMHLPVTTVRSRLARARELLQHTVEMGGSTRARH